MECPGEQPLCGHVFFATLTINQPISQSVSQSVSQPVSQSVSKSVGQFIKSD